MRIEGSHEIVELVPGGRSADPGPYRPPAPESGLGPEPTPGPEPAAARLTEWWRAGPAQEWRVRAQDRLARIPAVRSAMQTAAGIPERARVIIALVAIAAIGFIALGVGARFLIQDFVTGRADAQLKATEEQLEPALRSRAFYLYLRPLPEGVVAQRHDLDDGDIREFGGFSNDSSTLGGPKLPSPLPAASDRPFTVADKSGTSQWLVRVTPVPGRESLLVVAADIGPGYQMTGRLTEIAVVIGGLAVAAMAFVGFRAVRSSAPPMTEIEETVEAAVAGDLSRRVPEPPTDGEQGQVVRAVNTLIEQIDDARREAEHARQTVGEAGQAMRQPLNIIQGFTSVYRDRSAQDPDRMARMIDRVGDEAARIEIVIDDLVSDMSHAGNGKSGLS